MLTSDLVRVSVQRGQVVPRYVDATKAANRELATSLIAIFKRHRGDTRGELDAELEEFLGTGTQFLLHRGLSKLLFDRCRFDTRAQVDPPTLRRVSFEAAAEAYRSEVAGSFSFDRGTVIARLGKELGLDQEGADEEFERNLYADLKNQQVMEEFPPVTSEWLLARYNCALAQAVLYRAVKLDIRLAGQRPVEYRALLRKIKFFQLLHRVTPVKGDGSAPSGYRIELDGPLSLFKASQRYGVRMASFLPTLLHFQGWTLEAGLRWGKQRQERSFRLTPESGLESHTKLTGQWQPEEIAWLAKEFPKLDTKWEIGTDAELVDLGGQGVLVPDFVFHHKATGKRVYLEVFGFWNRGSVLSRLRLLEQQGSNNLILALPRSMNVDAEALSEIPAAVYLFRRALSAREVLKRLRGFEE